MSFLQNKRVAEKSGSKKKVKKQDRKRHGKTNRQEKRETCKNSHNEKTHDKKSGNFLCFHNCEIW